MNDKNATHTTGMSDAAKEARWADSYTQARNRTDNVFITINGKTMIQEDWSKELNVSTVTLRKWRKKNIIPESKPLKAAKPSGCCV